VKLTKLLVPLALLGSFWVQPARAGGSLPLSDILPLIQQSEALEEEVNTALQNAGTTPEEITCVGARLGRHFGPLGAARVAPFDCLFPTPNETQKKLGIEAENLVKLPDGSLVTLEEFLKINPMPAEATLNFKLQSWFWEEQRE